jgi:hypothetical protein
MRGGGHPRRERRVAGEPDHSDGGEHEARDHLLGRRLVGTQEQVRDDRRGRDDHSDVERDLRSLLRREVALELDPDRDEEAGRERQEDQVEEARRVRVVVEEIQDDERRVDGREPEHAERHEPSALPRAFAVPPGIDQEACGERAEEDAEVSDGGVDAVGAQVDDVEDDDQRRGQTDQGEGWARVRARPAFGTRSHLDLPIWPGTAGQLYRLFGSRRGVST